MAAERLADRGHRDAVLQYLESPGLSPFPLRRLAEQKPEGASQVFARILKRPAFRWERDGEALLRRYKADDFEREPLPSVIPVNESAIPGRMAGLWGETE